jgi:hypothetical protein
LDGGNGLGTFLFNTNTKFLLKSHHNLNLQEIWQAGINNPENIYYKRYITAAMVSFYSNAELCQNFHRLRRRKWFNGKGDKCKTGLKIHFEYNFQCRLKISCSEQVWRHGRRLFPDRGRPTYLVSPSHETNR